MRLAFRAAFLWALAAGILSITSAWTSAWAQADSRGLSDRLDRLERDLNAVQVQVYRNQGGPATITSPALGGGSGGGLSGDAYSRLDDRISAIENQMRDMTGQLEKAAYAAQQLQSKLERAQADNDIRFKELEQKLAAGGPAAAAPPAGGKTAANNGQGGEWNPTMGSPPGNLSHSGGKGGEAPPPPPPPPGAAAGGGLPGKTPQEKYDYAFGLLRGFDYDGAAKAFQTFVAQHPQDPLAGNAMYWLGQIPYTQGNYEQAVPIFLEAYRKYPKSAKAGESLLKVGLSLSNMGKKKEACAALSRFTSEYSDAGDSLKRQAGSEKSKLGC